MFTFGKIVVEEEAGLTLTTQRLVGTVNTEITANVTGPLILRKQVTGGTLETIVTHLLGTVGDVLSALPIGGMVVIST